MQIRTLRIYRVGGKAVGGEMPKIWHYSKDFGVTAPHSFPALSSCLPSPFWRYPATEAFTSSFPMACLSTITKKFLEGVRTEQANGKPLYCARDIAAKLGMTRGGIGASAWYLPDHDRTHRMIPTGHGPQMHLFITEAGFWRLAMAGRTPESKAFRKLVSCLELPPSILPPEAALVASAPPAEVLALEPAARRNHVLFWLSTTAAIASSPRRHEAIAEIVASGGVSFSNCYRYFRRWVKSGGDWRVFDRWASLRKSPARSRHGIRTAREN